MPTSKRSAAAVPMQPMFASTDDPWGIAEGENPDDGFLKPSEFRTNGYFAGGEQRKMQPAAPPRQQQQQQQQAPPRRDVARTHAPPQPKAGGAATPRNVATPAARMPQVAQQEPAALAAADAPQYFNGGGGGNAGNSNNIRAMEVNANRNLLEVPTEVNYTVMKHVMRTGSSQNLQVSRWCSSFRDADGSHGNNNINANGADPAAHAHGHGGEMSKTSMSGTRRRNMSAEPTRRPTWNSRTKNNVGWMSMEELNQEHLKNIQAQTRRAARAAHRQPYNANQSFEQQHDTREQGMPMPQPQPQVAPPQRAAAPQHPHAHPQHHRASPTTDVSGSSFDVPSSSSFTSSCGKPTTPAGRTQSQARIRDQLTATKQRLQACLGETYGRY